MGFTHLWKGRHGDDLTSSNTSPERPATRVVAARTHRAANSSSQERGQRKDRERP